MQNLVYSPGIMHRFIKGREKKLISFVAPLYMVPEDLQNINLGDFDQSLKGRSIIGEIKNNKLVPYKNREQIDMGGT